MVVSRSESFSRIGSCYNVWVRGLTLRYVRGINRKSGGRRCGEISIGFAIRVRIPSTSRHLILWFFDSCGWWLVPWCNGSTTDFGSVGWGSNPWGTTTSRFYLVFSTLMGIAELQSFARYLGIEPKRGTFQVRFLLIPGGTRAWIVGKKISTFKWFFIVPTVFVITVKLWFWSIYRQYTLSRRDRNYDSIKFRSFPSSRVAELADAVDSKSAGQNPCEFEPHLWNAINSYTRTVCGNHDSQRRRGVFVQFW